MRLLAPAVALVLVCSAAPAAGRRGPARPGGCRPLANGVKLPVAGRGWLRPATWAARGLAYGTPELVALIKRTAQRLARAVPGTTLYVADLSPRGGGPSRWHRTHRRGVDVDLLLFARDAQGRPAAPGPAMVPFSCDGHGARTDGAGNPVAPLTLDVARSWALVRALVEDPRANLAEILIANCLRRRLLEHARASRTPRAIVEHAERLMRQPRVSPHNDHIHVRIVTPEGPCVAAAGSWPARRRLSRRR